MIKLTRLNGEIIYLNYIQILGLEQIPETKVRMANGDFYLVQESVETIRMEIRRFLRAVLSPDASLKHL